MGGHHLNQERARSNIVTSVWYLSVKATHLQMHLLILVSLYRGSTSTLLGLDLEDFWVLMDKIATPYLTHNSRAQPFLVQVILYFSTKPKLQACIDNFLLSMKTKLCFGLHFQAMPVAIMYAVFILIQASTSRPKEKASTPCHQCLVLGCLGFYGFGSHFSLDADGNLGFPISSKI